MKPVKQLLLILTALCLLSSGAFGASVISEITIEGVVIDERTQKPLQGANIYIEETGQGASTDHHGYFSITVGHEEGTLIISYLGYKVQRYQLSELALLQISEFSLQPININSGSELIVTTDQAHMAYMGMYSDVKTKPVEDHISTIPGMDMVTRANFAKDPVIRGLRDGRINVLIDGMRMTPACVDGMDPLTGYVETDNLETIDLQRGGQGSSAPGGTLNFNMVKPSINSGWRGNLETGFHTVSNQQVYQGSINYGEEKWAARVSGTYRDAGNFVTGSNERISLSGFKKGNMYASILYKPGASHDLSIQYIGDFAGDAGYPALIMDTRRADAHAAGLEHNWTNPGMGISSIKTRLYLNRVEHWMDDYDRDVTDREVMTDMHMPMYGETTTYGLNSTIKTAKERYMFALNLDAYGMDAFADMWMHHLNPDVSDMYLLNLPHVSTRNASVSADYQYFTSTDWVIGVNGRLEAGQNQIGEHGTYRAEYPDLNDLEPTIMVYSAGLNIEKQLFTRLNSGAKLSDGYRMPDHMELYGYYIYQPLDNFFYYGNPGLEPERSSQAELFFIYGNNSTNFHGSASLWVNRMNRYITGNKIDNLFKRYENMGTAILTGAELDLHYNFSNQWDGGASLSYVFGQHSELDEPLPMIPPMKGTAFLQRQTERIGLESRIRWAAAQNRIAEENSIETETGSYLLWDFFGRLSLVNNLRLQVGVENILNTFYIDHLSVNSLPATGRNVHLSLRYTF
ncbi:MAG: TonB-dependent receptor [Balneolaceae bacterium]